MVICLEFHSSYFEIKWYDQSYLVNAAMYPQYNYTLLEESTGIQRQVSFLTPFPNQNTALLRRKKIKK